MRNAVGPRPLLALTAVLALVAGAGCGGEDDKTPSDAGAAPAAVALDLEDAPSLKIGVVVSLTSAPGEGSDWASAAEGAAVAAYRFTQGGTSVTLLPQNDSGTDEGAQSAVQDLAAAGVGGIVLATSGTHVDAALRAASDAGLPVLLPYADTAGDLEGLAWRTGPDEDQVGAALSAALGARAVTRPLLIDAGGGTPSGLEPASSLAFRPGDDAAALAREVARAQDDAPQPDSLVVTGPATLQASVVAALQGHDVDLPLFLSPEALSPEFATALVAAGGSTDLDATTVGTTGGDSTALQAGDEGDAASAFFAALRQAAGDPDLQDYFDGRPFSSVAGDADVRSHDAVVALVEAAAAAGSAEPDAVADALGDERVTAADGLAGPALDFGDPSALADDQVVALQATSQDSGLRPAGDGPGLSWFAVSPASS